MIWGAFVGSWKLNMVVMEPKKRTGSDFVEQVNNQSLQNFLNSYPNSGNLVLMEDGALVHQCLVSKAWRINHSIQKLEWPANSPDLNPIENIWALMKDAISTKYTIKNISQMKEALQAEWDKIPESKFNELVASMPDRIQAVLQAHGGHTRW
jgi:transposase